MDRPIDPLHDRLVIAVGPSSPATVKTNLCTALDARRQPGPPVLTQLEVDALADFDACLRAAWPATEVLTHEAIAEISKVTQVLVVDPEGPACSAWAVLLAPALQDPADGETVGGELEGICADLMAARLTAAVTRAKAKALAALRERYFATRFIFTSNT